MFFDFGLGETYQVIIETYLGDQLIRQQPLNAPEQILKLQFMALIKQIAQENKPMKCKMILYDIIWDEIEKKEKVLENYIEFKNKLMEG